MTTIHNPLFKAMNFSLRALTLCAGIDPGAVVRENGGAEESGSTKNHALVQWFKAYSEEEELKYIASMRKKVRT